MNFKSTNVDNKIKKILLIIFIYIFLIFIGFDVLYIKNNANANNEIVFEKDYFIGESVNIPNIFFLVGGKKILADKIIILPNNVIKKVDRLILTYAGEYHVIYSASNLFENVKKDYSFIVQNYKYNTINSSLSYVNYKDKELFNTIYGEVYKNGLEIVLSNGAQFKYNDIINLNELQGESFINLFIIAGKEGIYDFSRLTVTLTDVCDSDNFVTFELDLELDAGGKGINISYIRAGHGEENTVGLEGNIIHKNGRYGCVANTSFESKDLIGDPLNLKLSNVDKVAYVNNKFICNLSSEEYFITPWKGFSTGECLLSIQASNFNSNQSKIFVDNIGNFEITSLSNNKSSNIHKPEIKIDLENFSESNIPNAVKGAKYKAFNATAFEKCGNIKYIDTRVFRQYNSNKINVELIDGYFRTDYDGIYTLEYTASDYFGVTTVKTIDIFCNDEGIMNIFLMDTNISGNVGVELKVSDYKIISSGGKVSTKIIAQKNDEVIDISSKTLAFIPNDVGEWKIIYKFTDKTLQHLELICNCIVTPKSQPVFSCEAQLPQYLIAGFNNYLPEIQAFDYSVSKNTVDVNIFVKEGDNNERKLNNNLFCPVFDKQDYIAIIRYEAIGSQFNSEKIYECKVRVLFENNTSNKIMKDKLFVASKGILPEYRKLFKTDLYASVIYKFNNSGKISYVNSLPANNFSLCFKIINGNFSSIKISLTDSIDRNEIINIIINQYQNNFYLRINDGFSYKLNNSILENAFDFCYLSESKSLSFNNGCSIYSVNNSFSENDFEGFESNKIYAEIIVEEPSDSFELNVKKICNQVLDSSTEDETNPIRVFDKSYEVQYNKGSIITLSNLIVSDAIKPYVPVFISVINSKNEYVIDQNGLELNKVDNKEYVIMLNDYGQYTISYTIDGKERAYEYKLLVPDNVSPVITLNKNLRDIYKINTSISFYVNISDNIDIIKNYYVAVIDINGVVTILEKQKDEDYKYNFINKGNYYIIIFAFDNSGNYGEKSIHIKCI